MLRLEYTDANGTHFKSWHYGESLSEGYLTARVLKVTADGDELDLLLATIRATIKPVTVIDVTEADSKLCWTCEHQHPCYVCKAGGTK